ncbi:hypothetical protein [Massilia sp. Leaf139]|uniref:hypothetical protein n=1 Tax=Massilia sp. Leaf139 TaxID=1736272 RepID=UPI0006F7780A|nr:hypothetical protein [Massilia sp. Leaf139]KQQ87886.1 hypothetical protein ASF77_14225 [Massilia sp. Leaf139]
MKHTVSLRRSLLAAAAILGGAAALRWATPDLLSVEWAQRLTGALLGIVVVFYANVIPKSLTSLARLRSPQAEQAARRFAGWSLVLGGLGYMLAMLLAPLAWMHLAGGAVLAVALLAAVLRCLGARDAVVRG